MSGYQELAEKATARLIQQHSPSGRRIGFIMIALILTEAWDLYSISFRPGIEILGRLLDRETDSANPNQDNDWLPPARAIKRLARNS